MKREYKEYLSRYLKENELKLDDDNKISITIQLGDNEKKNEKEYETLFNDETPGRLNFNYDDDLESLYRIEKSINTILSSDAMYSNIQTHNSVINPNTNELHITITTKEDDCGIINNFHTALKDWNEGINNIKGFKYNIERSPDMLLGSNGENGKNKSVAIITVGKGLK